LALTIEPIHTIRLFIGMPAANFWIQEKLSLAGRVRKSESRLNI
jgi:hypothetical protein